MFFFKINILINHIAQANNDKYICYKLLVKYLPLHRTKQLLTAFIVEGSQKFQFVNLAAVYTYR